MKKCIAIKKSRTKMQKILYNVKVNHMNTYIKVKNFVCVKKLRFKEIFLIMI